MLPAVSGPEPVEPQRFGSEVAARLAGQGRLLHLCHGPDGGLLAVGQVGDELFAVNCTGREGIDRPSAHGVEAARWEEERLGALGVTWAPPADQQPAVRGRGVFTMPMGPVHGDAAESVGWHLDVMGDEILAARLHFGWKRRGVAVALSAQDPVAGVRVAECVTGTSPVAHQLAYCQAWEAALGLPVPAPAEHWRGVFAETERVASHLGDLANLSAACGLPVAAQELQMLRDMVLSAAQDLTGHRYLRGAVRLGGVEVEPPARAALALATRLAAVGRRLWAVVGALAGTGTFLDRLVGTGRVDRAVASRLTPVGPVGRACGLSYDVRVHHPYGPYVDGAPAAAHRPEGDAWARYSVRVDELRASLEWLGRRLEGGPLSLAPAPTPSRRATDGTVVAGRAEGPRGEVLYLVSRPAGPGSAWVRLRGASAVNWPVVPGAVANGNMLQDVPIIEASFGLSVASLDQ